MLFSVMSGHPNHTKQWTIQTYACIFYWLYYSFMITFYYTATLSVGECVSKYVFYEYDFSPDIFLLLSQHVFKCFVVPTLKAEETDKQNIKIC